MENSCLRISLLSAISLLSGCGALGWGPNQEVGSSSATIPSAYLRTSVPYIICPDQNDRTRYLLIPPAKLPSVANPNRVDSRKDEREGVKAYVQETCGRNPFEEGDPLTVILHRVGVSGLSNSAEKYLLDNSEKKRISCSRGCKRDVAVVIDINAQGGGAYQPPIVAFYQTGLPDGGQLQLNNLIIYNQTEWHRENPPVVRVRLYDVRDDKNAILKSRLDFIQGFSKEIGEYLAGASSAGPIISAARRVADTLISNFGNRTILDIQFQLYPQENSSDEVFAQVLSDGPMVVFSERPVSLQKDLIVPPRDGEELPDFYYYPDGIKYGGARIYSANEGSAGLHPSPFVAFSLNKFQGSVSADVKKRMSELTEKFAVGSSVSQANVQDATQFLDNLKFASKIDRLQREPGSIAYLGDLILYLDNVRDNSSADDVLVRRANRIINSYTGCNVPDTDLEELEKFVRSGKIQNGKISHEDKVACQPRNSDGSGDESGA